MEFKLESKPFSWNDNFSEDALEVFSALKLGYVSHQLLGMALAKLKILEEQGAKVDEKWLCGDCEYGIDILGEYCCNKHNNANCPNPCTSCADYKEEQ